MRVRLTTDRVGWNWEQWSGEVYDLPDQEALALIKANQAERVDEPKPNPKKGKSRW